jgi:hypothetical protein
MQYLLGAVGVFGIAVAYFQWVTASQKVGLDLFDRRFQVFNDVRKACSAFHVTARFDDESDQLYCRAMERAHFLFGPEVKTYLQAARSDLISETTLTKTGQPGDLERRRRLLKFYEDTDRLMSPYMALRQPIRMWWPF